MSNIPIILFAVISIVGNDVCSPKEKSKELILEEIAFLDFFKRKYCGSVPAIC